MPNDTPSDPKGSQPPFGLPPEPDAESVAEVSESQDPFISERNEPPVPGVQAHMDETTHTTPQDHAALSATLGEDSETPITGEIDLEPPTNRSLLEDDLHAEPERVNDQGPDDTLFMTPGAVHGATTWDGPPTATDDGGSTVTPPSHAADAADWQGHTTRGRQGSMVMFVLVAVVSGVIGALLTYGVLTAAGAFDTEAAAPPVAVATTVPATPIVTEITNSGDAAVNPTVVAQKVMPSIVTVNVYEGTPDDGLIPTGSGSGVVMSTDGYLITNHHVIDGADSYNVTFEDGRTYEADLIGSDSLTDLAVLQISADNLVPIEFGSADALAVGDPAVAVGNPLGQDGGASITSGIISAFDRRVDFADDTSLFGMIQTDAAINSGSSGGALVNAEGKLVGITSAIGVSTAGPEGIGYAIPVELVERITSEIIETGDVAHPFLGVTIQTYFDTAADGASYPAGAIIESIEPADSAAGVAGIAAGDIVINIGGEPISSQTDLILEVRLYRVGDVVSFTVDRNGELLDFDVTMGQRPENLQG